MRGKNDRYKQKTSKEADGLQEKKDGRLEEPVAVEEERRGGCGDYFSGRDKRTS